MRNRGAFGIKYSGGCRSDTECNRCAGGSCCYLLPRVQSCVPSRCPPRGPTRECWSTNKTGSHPTRSIKHSIVFSKYCLNPANIFLEDCVFWLRIIYVYTCNMSIHTIPGSWNERLAMFDFSSGHHVTKSVINSSITFVWVGLHTYICLSWSHSHTHSALGLQANVWYIH